MSTAEQTLTRSSGFTLLEILVVMVIAVLMLTLIPPLFSSAVSGTKLKGSARDFVVVTSVDVEDFDSSKRWPAALCFGGAIGLALAGLPFSLNRLPCFVSRTSSCWQNYTKTRP